MKVFVDKDGNVIGTYHSPDAQVEAKAGMPDAVEEIAVSGHIADKLLRGLSHRMTKINKGDVVEMSDSEKKAFISRLKQEEKERSQP